MKTKTKNENKNYLTTSAQHLFIVNDKFIFKLIEFEVDGKLHYAKLMVNPQSVTITNIVTTWYKQSYKQDLFPQYLKNKIDTSF
jgi:hypothetical protein